MSASLRLLLLASSAVWMAGAPVTTTEVFQNISDSLRSSFRLENSPTAQKYLPEAMAGGVAVFDFDNDGRMDLFFTNGARVDSPMPQGKRPEKSDPKFFNRLFHQESDGTFKDVTAMAGLAGEGFSMGVAAADYDNDGFTDLLVTGLDRTLLYRNNGNGTFTDVSAKAGLSPAGWTASAGFFDYNNDGQLDLFVTRYVEWDFLLSSKKDCVSPGGGRLYCHPKLFPAVASLLYRNNGDGTFTDVSAASGVATLKGRGLGVAFADYDLDGFTDVYVANDSMQSFLWHNNGDGTFTNKAVGAGVALNEDGGAFAGMGVEFADYDNDGLPDLAVTDLAKDTYMLFHNDGKGVFTNVTIASGLGKASYIFSGWGIHWLDVDNDGWKDLFVAQGDIDDHSFDGSRIRYRQEPLLLRNRESKLLPWAGNTGAALAKQWIGRGAATGDLDNDGRTDLVATSLGEGPYVLRNSVARTNNWIGIRPRGVRSNRDGIGCRLKVVSASGATQYFTVNTAGSYLSSSDRRVIAGLGASTSAKWIEAVWPSGTTQRVENVKAGQWIDLVEPGL